MKDTVMRSPVSSLLFIGVIVLCIVAGAGYLLFKDTTPPEVALNSDVKVATPGQKFSVTATDENSGIRSITVTIRKNSQTQILVKEIYPEKPGTATAEFALKDTFLRDGAFTMIVNARDGSFAGFGQGNSATREFNMRLDATPPKVLVKTSRPNILRGGSGCVSYTVSREVESTGVVVDNQFFPGYQQDNGDYVCFFPFPYYVERQNYMPKLMVTDLAGNKSSTPLAVTARNHIFKKDTIKISDRFLNLKMPEFQPQIPGTDSLVDLFNKVNGELRQSNAAKLLELGQKSAPHALWDDAFIQLPNSAVRANFGEHRTYMYDDQKLEVEATHLGLDLASIARSPIPAGNSGIVIFADYLGIYGNMVVLDHGLGLQSIYSHMSEISVTEGQEVKRGDVLGKTGTSGMAVGDHLHFGILISGLEVSPIEWLDHKWIRDNITDRLKEAGTPGPELAQLPAAEEHSATPQSASQRRRR